MERDTHINLALCLCSVCLYIYMKYQMNVILFDRMSDVNFTRATQEKDIHQNLTQPWYRFSGPLCGEPAKRSFPRHMAIFYIKNSFKNNLYTPYVQIFFILFFIFSCYGKLSIVMTCNPMGERVFTLLYNFSAHSLDNNLGLHSSEMSEIRNENLNQPSWDYNQCVLLLLSGLVGRHYTWRQT